MDGQDILQSPLSKWKVLKNTILTTSDMDRIINQIRDELLTVSIRDSDTIKRSKVIRGVGTYLTSDKSSGSSVISKNITGNYQGLFPFQLIPSFDQSDNYQVSINPISYIRYLGNTVGSTNFNPSTAIPINFATGQTKKYIILKYNISTGDTSISVEDTFSLDTYIDSGNSQAYSRATIGVVGEGEMDDADMVTENNAKTKKLSTYNYVRTHLGLFNYCFGSVSKLIFQPFY